MILQMIISNGILDLVTGILAKISLGTGIWAKFRLGTGIWYPPFTTLFNDWSRGEQWILFPENLIVSRDEVEGNIEIRGQQISLFPKGPVIKWFVIEQNKTKAKFENRAEIPAITCNSGQHFAGNSELFPVWCHSFRNVARSWHLAGNSFIIRCHVTMN